MTDDRARKQAIRRRMAETGEKYTAARRALLHGAPAEARPYWYDESHWEGIRKGAERISAEQGEPVARVGVYQMLNTQISLGFMPLRFRGYRWDAESDIAAIEASAPLIDAGYGPQIERNRRILERIAALMRERPAPAPVRREESTEDRDRRLAAEARLRSSVAAGPTTRAQELDHEAWEPGRDGHLRHPPADWFRWRRQEVDDAELRELLDAWIEEYERAYAELVAGIPAAWREHGEFAFEALIDSGAEASHPEPSAEWGSELASPAHVRVEKRIKGELAEGEEVATHIHVVDGRLRSSLEGITAVVGERWQIRGHRLRDATIMPCRGSYRLARAAQP